MPFPAEPLPVRVYLAPGATLTNPNGWVWTDVTDDVLVADGISIETGRPDEATEVDPGQCRLRLLNTGGRYSPRNPSSPYYGRLARNTPLRVTVKTLRDAFGRTATDSWGVSDSGHTWSTYQTPGDYDVTGGAGTITYSATTAYRLGWVEGMRFADGDATMTWSWSPAAVTGGPLSAIIFLRGRDEGDHFALVQASTSGVMTVALYDRLGLTLVASATAAVTYSQGAQYTMRVQASGEHVRIRVWAAAGAEPTSWDVVGQLTDLWPGYIGFGGLRSSTNTNNNYVQTIHAVSVEAERHCGYVAEWPSRWDMSGRLATAPITSSGVLRRLGQGAAALHGALRRYITADTDPIGYWPLEDGDGATWAASGLPAGPQADAGGDPQFGADGPDGGTTAVAVAAGDRLTVAVPGGTPGGWSVGVALIGDGSTAAGVLSVGWDTPGGSAGVVRWGLSVDIGTGAASVARVDSTGTTTTVLTHALTFPWADGWYWVTVTATQAGADISLALDVHGDLQTTTVAGQTAGGVTRVAVSTSGAGSGPCARIGHITVWDTPLTTTQVDNLIAALGGWNPSRALDRIGNLCAQEGILCSTPPPTPEATWVGVQRPASLLSLLREAEASDGGVLYERGPGLAYLPRDSRVVPVEAQASADNPLTLSFNDLAEPPEPTDDDQRLRNTITVSQVNGSSVTAAVDTGEGEYTDSVTVNLARTGGLRHHAGWLAYLGTVDEARWPRVVFDLNRAAGARDVWPGIVVGDRLQLTDPPPELPPDDVEQVIEGWTEHLSPHSWRVEVAGSPASPWHVGEYDDDLGDYPARYSTAGSQLASSATTTATSLSVATTSGPLWTTAAADLPLDLNIGGERVRVTAVSGASSPQTMTVTRSINGVVKAHDAGTVVELWRPSPYVY